MKNMFKSFNAILIAVAALLFAAGCQKEKLEYKPLSKASSNPAPDKIDPGSGSANTTLTLTGTGIGDVVKIVFSNGNISAGINPVFNTESSLVFRVPDIANGGDQQIIFTNSLGKEFSVPFKVIALPVVSSASHIDYQEGDVVTLAGNNLEDVSEVLFEPSGTAVTIISKEKNKLVVQMPASTVNTTKLKITNSSGTAVTTQEFVNVAAAYGIFKDELGAGIDNWSWSLNIDPTTEDKITGTASMKAEYTGGWGGMQLHWGAPVNLAEYKYVTFWIKGADVEKKMKFNFNWTNDQTLTIPANVWTYYKIDLNVFKNAGVSALEFFIMQIHDDPKTLLMDNMMLVK
jgi:hypothetical protein